MKITPQVTQPDPPLPFALRDIGFCSGELAVDIGANIGITATELAVSHGWVLAYEPAVESYDLLVTLAQSVENIIPINKAVSASGGVVTLAVTDHIEIGELVDPEAIDMNTKKFHGWDAAKITPRQVQTTTLDAIARGADGTIATVKIDVEGHELKVIDGGMSFLHQQKPKLVIEIHRKDLGDAILRSLMNVGYTMDDVALHRHPYYADGTWGADNHYWMVVSPPIQP